MEEAELKGKVQHIVDKLRHLVDDMAYADGLSHGGEETAYLTGNITLGVADIVCRYSCENCRQH